MKRSATEPIKPRKPIEPIKPINHQNRTDPFTALRDVFQKKIAQKETLVHSHLTLSLLSLNGTRGIGTQKIVY